MHSTSATGHARLLFAPHFVERVGSGPFHTIVVSLGPSPHSSDFVGTPHTTGVASDDWPKLYVPLPMSIWMIRVVVACVLGSSSGSESSSQADVVQSKPRALMTPAALVATAQIAA